MLDLRGQQLAQDERELLMHPLVGGIILFARNYHDDGQLTELCAQVHDLRSPPLLIAVDHEGGRVQRFHDHFTTLPSCRRFGEQYDANPERGLRLSELGGWLMAAELLAVGVDFSFAPVLDLDRGISQVVGDRAFHRDAEAVAVLARRFMRGMKEAGMAAVGKHYPGHGGVPQDSHHETPVDDRRYEEIAMSDLLPFERLIQAGLPAVMPAHVLYPAVDRNIAGYSAVWLQRILREQLGFQGVIFSDDICMEGAGVAGGHTERTRAALAAGCDMVLICHNRNAAIKVLEDLDYTPHPASQARLMRMHGRGAGTTALARLRDSDRWQTANRMIAGLELTPELEFGDDEIKS
jgi:beta-N-acetylhexosaminidase